MKRKTALLAATLVIILTVLAGCGGKTASPSPAAEQKPEQKVVQLTFWGGWTGPDGDVMRDIVKKWNADNPNIQVTLETQQWTPLFEKFITASKAGNQPDILAMHGPDIPQFVELGLLTPLDDIIAQNGLKKEDFATPAWNSNIYKGKLYGIPLDMHMHGLYYNTDLFKQAGITKAPATGKELIDAGIKLTVDAKGKHPNDPGFDASNVKQWGLGMNFNHHGFFQWYALINQQGDHLLTADGKKTDFEDAKGVKAWQFIEDLIFKYRIVPPGEQKPFDDFRAGKVAMLIDGPWQLPALESQPGLNWDTAPYPTVFDKPAVWGSGHTLTLPVNKNKEKQDAAIKFIVWLEQNAQLWAKSGNIPAKLSVSGSDDFKKLKGRGGFTTQLPNVVMLPGLVKEAQAFSASATSPIVQAAQAAMLKNAPPNQVNKILRDGLDSILGSP